jgi:carbon starvation protein
VNSLVFTALSVGILSIGYAFYGGRFAKFLGVDPARPTPAHTKFDGIDYVPAKHWLVIFGHHFASIAGAGPIIGPTIAVIFWGWGPAVLFVLFGTIFIGGIHDFGSLFISIRNDGVSVANVAEKLISRRARHIFSWFVLLALVVVVAVFVYFCADTFVVEPKIVLPSLGLIPVAVLTGAMIYVLRVNLAISTIAGLALLVSLIFLGQVLPVDIPGSGGMTVWIIVLLVYCFFASVLPVNILLQPRDYLSSYLLFFGVIVGLLGVITARPNFTTSAFIKWSTKEGSLWPMLFVTIACGAISGFHALVAGGTTAKQIANERDAKRVGYGAMVVESLVAVIAIVAIGAGFSGMPALQAAVSKGGPVNAFGDGFGYLTRFILGKYGKFIAIILLNSFILTTLDTATRIARYILQELFGRLDRFLATMLIILAGGWANQLVAALTLIVITSWLLCQKKHVKYVFIPALFMLVTSVGALGAQLGTFIANGDLFLMAVDVALSILAVGLILEVYGWMRRCKIQS